MGKEEGQLEKLSKANIGYYFVTLNKHKKNSSDHNIIPPPLTHTHREDPKMESIVGINLSHNNIYFTLKQCQRIGARASMGGDDVWVPALISDMSISRYLYLHSFGCQDSSFHDNVLGEIRKKSEQ